MGQCLSVKNQVLHPKKCTSGNVNKKPHFTESQKNEWNEKL